MAGLGEVGNVAYAAGVPGMLMLPKVETSGVADPCVAPVGRGEYGVPLLGDRT